MTYAETPRARFTRTNSSNIVFVQKFFYHPDAHIKDPADCNLLYLQKIYANKIFIARLLYELLGISFS